MCPRKQERCEDFRSRRARPRTPTLAITKGDQPMKNLVTVAVVAMLSACATPYGKSGIAGFYKNKDHIAQYDGLYKRINDKFNGKCPATITIGESNIPGISRFNISTSEILISRNHKGQSIIAHETVHLCMNELSNGASSSSKYRFIDEGYAKFYGDTMSMPEEEFKRITMEKARKYAKKSLISFDQVMDWSAYFGYQGKGGVLGFEAYYVGSSFYFFIKETYGEDKFFKLVQEIGTSMTFNRALISAIGKNDTEIELEWLKYISESK
jgi:hypothetical protein